MNENLSYILSSMFKFPIAFILLKLFINEICVIAQIGKGVLFLSV